MRVFVTGATGFVGSAIVPELLSAGHKVLGLVRSDANATALAKTGAEVHRGSLEDLASLRAGAEKADAVIHTAFNHDFTNYAANAELDKNAINALGETLLGSQRPLIVTSGLAMLAPGRLATERDEPAKHFPRVSEATALALADRGVKAMSIRLAPTVHGDGDHGFVPFIIGTARAKGVSAYVGDGQNRWPTVHRFDAAKLYRLAVEKGEARAAYHGVAEQGIPFRHIAEMIGKRLGIPVVSKSADEAPGHFEWMAMFAGADMPASSDLTQKQLGWTPSGVGLLQDLERGTYFDA